MLLLKVDTAVEVFVNALPLLDDTDFKTRETAVAYNAAGMDLVWNFQTPAGVVTQTAVTPTTGGSYDWTHVGDGMYKIEIPASGGASINNDAEGHGWFSGVATGVLPWVSPIYTFVPAHVADGLVTGSDKLQVDAQEWLGTAIATPDTVGYPKVTIKDGTGTGELDTASGKVSLVAGDITSIQSGLATASALSTVSGLVDDLETRLTATRAGYLDNLQDSRQGLCSYGVLDAGGAGSFTLPSGQRANVAAGDAIYIPGKGARLIASGYNTSTGAGTTVSNFDSAAATSDAYVVFKLPKSEPLTSADLTDGLLTSAKFADAFLTAAKLAADCITAAKVAADVTTELQSGLATSSALSTLSALVDDLETRLTATRAGYLDNLATAPPTAAAIADQVWDEAIAGHVGAGSTGEALTAAGSAGDPWSTAIPGAYGSGSAGHILGNQLPAVKAKTDNLPADPADASDVAASFTAVNTKLDTIDDFLDTEVAAIKAKTDNLPAAPAAVSDIPTAVQNADALLGRNIGGGSSTGRTVESALAVLRNKTVIDANAGTITVYDTDDSTVLWSGTITLGSRSPLTAVDPA